MLISKCCFRSRLFMRLHCIDEFFDKMIFQKKQFVTLLYIAYHCFECFIHQCFLIHILHVSLLLETSHEHESHINWWNISDIIEKHSSIFLVYLIIYEHCFFLFFHIWFFLSIIHLVCKRYFIHETFKIVNERITTIKVVYHAFSKRIVECLLNRHTRIFRCFCWVNTKMKA